MRANVSLVRLLAAGLALIAVAAACESDPTPTPAPTPTSAGSPPVNTPTPEPAGPAVERLIMAVAPPSNFYNIRRLPGQLNNWYLRPHYEYLVGFEKTSGRYVPQLATEWSLEPDRHSWRFILREGVTFHDGTDFTAEDVRYSWLMNILPDPPTSESTTLRTRVDDVVVVNDYEVVVRTYRPYADIFEIFSEIQGGMEIMSMDDGRARTSGVLAGMPSDSWGDLADDPETAHDESRLRELAGFSDPAPNEPPIAGTGPYAIISMDEQTGVVYRAVADHWRDAPDFAEFEFRFVPEASTRLAQLLSGESHLAKLPEDLAVEAQSRGFEIFTAKVPAARYALSWRGVYVPKGANLTTDRVSMNGLMAEKSCVVNPDADPADLPFLSCSVYPTTPFTDLRVRKALNKAIDREALNTAFFDGKGLTMHKNHFLPDNPQRVGWNPEWVTRWDDEYGYDPDAARALLAEAGYDEDNPLALTMAIQPLPAVPAGADVMGSIAIYWREIGVDVTETRVDPAELRAKNREMYWENIVTPIATSGAQMITQNVYGSSIIPIYYGGLQDPQVEEWLLQAYATNLPEERDGVLRQVGDRYYDIHADVPLFYLPNEVVGDPEVIADFVFSGMISGAPVDHLEGIAAR